MYIEEGALAFTFGPTWHDTVRKFDQHPDYLRMTNSLPETKAVDFIGICQESLILLEVKDFRGHRIETKQRLSTGELAVEVGLKVKDTIAAILGAHRIPEQHDSWREFVDLLVNTSQPVRVILWLEQDRAPQKPLGRDKVKRNVRGNDLKPKLKWLGAKVDVHSLQDSTPMFLDLQVSSLPRPAASLSQEGKT